MLSRVTTSTFTYFSKVISLCSVLLLLASCSSNQAPSKANKPSTAKVNSTLPEQISNEVMQNSSDILSELKANPQYSEQQIHSQRIKAASLAINEQRSSEYIGNIIDLINPNIVTTLDEDIRLAQLYAHVEQFDNAQIVLNRLQQGVLPKQYQLESRLLSARIDSYNEQYISALRNLFRLTQLYSTQFTEQQLKLSNTLIWQNILQTPINTLSSFKYEFGSEADSWLALADVMSNFVENPGQFKQSFNRWYQNHSAFASFAYLPQSIQMLAQSEPYQPKNIGLLLPISGKLSKQAEAIRNGFLAHNDFDTETQLTIIDTNKYGLADIEAIVTEQNVEFIVGPLLKEKIIEFQSSELLKIIPTLNLNTVSSADIAPGKEQFFYALAPEDEIEQAVEYFLTNKIENPALIYADNSLGRRLAQQFSQQWQLATENELETIAFKNKSKLGIAVKELLDVGLSEKRIKEIKGLFGNQIKSEQRSRTDIGAVYIIANSQQTRLIKPFFDVNVSTFGERLPIYASSRSYVVGESRVEKRDLNGLTFTEMTWMLKNNNNKATGIYNQIGEASTQSKKLFAFGYDARKLLPILSQLAILPDVSVQGLTGKLRVADKQRIKRNLEWSQYRNGQVIVLQPVKQ